MNDDKKLNNLLNETFDNNLLKQENNEILSNDTYYDNDIKEESNNLFDINSFDTNTNYEPINDEEPIEEKPIYEEKKVEEIPNDTKRDNKKNSKVMVLIIILSIILLIIILIGLFISKEKHLLCTYSVLNDTFKLEDSYNITYKGNKIILVEGNYLYKSLIDADEKQIEFIKDEKLPVILNSYGMPGFTFNFEENDNNFRVMSYLEYDKMDFKELNKINQEAVPLNYYKIKNNKFKDLKKYLISENYVCSTKK